VSYLRTAAGILFLSLVALGPSNAFAQSSKDKQDQKDQAVYLVARDPISDPFFHESVVLMLKPLPENPLVIGLIVNKPTRVPLSEIFPDDPALKSKTQTAFLGGPVDTDTPGVVFRSKKAVKQATLLFGDIYVSFDRSFIKGLLEKPEPGQDLRLFLGRAQWAPDQLQDEVLGGAWDNIRAEGSLIFGADQSYLWHMLSERAEPAPLAKLAGRPLEVF
jgi:putative transcriptional regulator